MSSIQYTISEESEYAFSTGSQYRGVKVFTRTTYIYFYVLCNTEYSIYKNSCKMKKQIHQNKLEDFSEYILLWSSLLTF